MALFGHAETAVRNGSKAPVCPSASHFRSTPNNGHCQAAPACLKGAKGGSRGRGLLVQIASAAKRE